MGLGSIAARSRVLVRWTPLVPLLFQLFDAGTQPLALRIPCANGGLHRLLRFQGCKLHCEVLGFSTCRAQLVVEVREHRLRGSELLDRLDEGIAESRDA